MAKILIVDDEKKMVSLIGAYLEREGFESIAAYDGENGLELFGRESPDLVVLDILMPGLDGYQFCAEVRKDSNVPIIIVSAKSEETDKIVGLELGADDYVTKPFSPRELVARVRAVLRRHQMSSDDRGGPIVEGPLIIDPEKRAVGVAGETVRLTPTEFDLLVVLASRPGRVYERRQLIELVQGDYFEGYERTVDTHVKNMRKKLGEKAKDWNFIETVYGVGYRFSSKRL